MRGDLSSLDELLEDDQWLRRQTWFALPAAAARLDALAVVGDLPTARESAAGLEEERSYLQPFALRSLGLVQEDEELVARADLLFRELRLDWHADQTDTLRRLRKLAG
jgi:hypothetical protein